MLALGVDTSEPRGGVALYDGRELADERWMDEPLHHAEQLFPAITAILAGNDVTKNDIDLVCVNRGPGSFTGLRIGLAAAKGLCQAIGRPLVGVDGMVAYRSRVPNELRVWVVVSSRRDLVYAQPFGGMRPRRPIALMHRSELIERLRQERREVILVGSGAPEVGASMSGAPLVRIAAEPLHRPSALSIARQGWSAQPDDRLYELEPLYVEPLLI